MKSFARFLGIGLALAGAAVAPSSLNAQETSDLNRLYSQGVNAYFAGRSSEAESYLSQALSLEGNNPLIYYFRALSLMRMGRVDEARGDMMVGANIEAQAPQRFAVGRTLERVQGGHRLMLEQYRRQARSQAANVPRQATQLQSRPTPRPRRQPQQASYNDEAVIRRRIVIPLDRLLGSGSPQPLSAEELSQRRVQVSGPQATRPQPAAAATPASAESEDPFRDDSTAGAAEATATQPTAAPTGTRQPEADDTTEPEATPVSGEETPEAEATPEDDENPFGNF
jgi:hypothetical protein